MKPNLTGRQAKLVGLLSSGVCLKRAATILGTPYSTCVSDLRVARQRLNASNNVQLAVMVARSNQGAKADE